MKLENDEYASFYKPYIEVLSNDDKNIIENLEYSLGQFEIVLGKLNVEKHLYQYADKKWTIKEIIQHIIDAERVFAYRALRFGRRDQTDLSGFDENDYVDNSFANDKNYQDLISEFISLRKSTIFLFANFSKETLLNKGAVEGNIMSVRVLGYIISGHLLHHLQVIINRYL